MRTWMIAGCLLAVSAVVVLQQKYGVGRSGWQMLLGSPGQQSRSSEGLMRYFSAVSLRGLSREAKLEEIAACFAPDARIEAGVGENMKTFSDPRVFYGGPTSPVLHEGFRPEPGAFSYSLDGKTIAVEIALTYPGKRIAVGDFFEFDEDGRITRLRVYSG
eukprot:TRINITY_DN86453_c0_g1_i1.p1 TRINITY_DN86453_c0_g1~~TRINITY_DN86453_c0_g1_i1.p1  ORF type:complete len:160 (+),score=32.51 TRINITY_DN86453_c0_g1_i1:107-586(+)